MERKDTFCSSKEGFVGCSKEKENEERTLRILAEGSKIVRITKDQNQ